MNTIWFYDNEQSNGISPTNSNISFIKVNGVETLEEIEAGGGKISDYFKKKFNNRKGRSTLEHVIQYETTDITSGINEAHVRQLIHATESGAVGGVVFDWDRTLTKTEGMLTVPQSLKSHIKDGKKRTVRQYINALCEENKSTCFDILTDKEFVEYYFHDIYDDSYKTRPEMIGELLNYLDKHNIPVYILTNSTIGYHSPGIMSDMLSKLTGRVTVPPNRVLFNIYKRDYDPGQYASGKERVIMEIIYEDIKKSNLRLSRSPLVLGTKKCHGKKNEGSCNILGGMRKRRKRRKTKRRKKRKHKLCKTRKLNV